MASIVLKNGTRLCPAEIRPASHRRAKRASILLEPPILLRDFLSDAADEKARGVFRTLGLDENGKPVSRGPSNHKTIVETTPKSY
jgi:hypothetical protein